MDTPPQTSSIPNALTPSLREPQASRALGLMATADRHTPSIPRPRPEPTQDARPAGAGNRLPAFSFVPKPGGIGKLYGSFVLQPRSPAEPASDSRRCQCRQRSRAPHRTRRWRRCPGTTWACCLGRSSPVCARSTCARTTAARRSCGCGPSKGLFVQLVQANTPASLVGLRFGDQILQIDGHNCVGWSADKAHRVGKKASAAKIVMVVRDRPFQQNVTMHKDSTGHVGFVIKKGKLISSVKGSSVARNGLLINHYVCEVNGQNVLGLKDKEVTEILATAGNVTNLTIIPTVIYEHMAVPSPAPPHRGPLHR
ncbi:syntenin-2 isoform X3 [Physeter macrocephalus]|uniref:Syntenin-2 isoform X3 n=1 Tax=Physeter macrocephalus TaxID=9755 RepID=A0A9W2X5M1_PHYMC|nr:syntenin-2 isoform X3 [Physeter catodon]